MPKSHQQPLHPRSIFHCIDSQILGKVYEFGFGLPADYPSAKTTLAAFLAISGVRVHYLNLWWGRMKVMEDNRVLSFGTRFVFTDDYLLGIRCLSR
jgi:hypothetical protein